MAPADAPMPLGFDVVRHGYDRTQVQKHVSTLEANLRKLTADRDSAHAQVTALTQQMEALRAQVGELREHATGRTVPLQANEEVHKQLRVMLEVTRAEAAEITARAQAAAEQTFASAQKTATTLRGRYELLIAELEAQQSQMQAEHAEVLEAQRKQLAEMSAQAEARRRRFGEQADAQHQQVEQEFEASMTARRATLDQEVADRRLTSQREAHKLVSDATAEAGRRTREAQAKIDQLTRLRQRVSERLRETSELFTKSSNLLEPVENEADIIAGKHQ
jgi:colicin import membrane protein